MCKRCDFTAGLVSVRAFDKRRCLHPLNDSVNPRSHIVRNQGRRVHFVPALGGDSRPWASAQSVNFV